MSKGNGMTSDMPYMKPEARSRWDAFRLSIYNPSTHEIFGRTCASWGALTVFYTIFYIVLAAFFAICMKGMMHTIDEKIPTFTLDYSLIGSSPGLGFRPIAEDVEKEGSLIWYQHTNMTNVQTWTDRVHRFLEPYHNTSSLKGGGLNHMYCDYKNPARKGKLCIMDMISGCSERDGYGYRNTAKPCVFIKLNKIFGWVPDFYNDPEDLPEEMPEDLKTHIRSLPEEKRNTIWVSCDGENPADKENIGIVQYPGNGTQPQGIPGYYFPYENQDGYLSPYVAIKFMSPKLNVLINIECRAWAKNINYRRHNLLREGSVHFELMID